MKIQTVNQLISVFKDISTRHYQINGFGVGDNWENGTSEKMHPVLWINPTTATMPSSDNGYKTFEIDFEVRVFDLVNKDESNEKEVLSDCIDILKDIITEFKGHPYYVNSQLNIIDDINFEAFTEEFDEEVSGWVCEISLMTPVLTSFCGIPSAEITGFEFPGADCPDVNVLCPVFVEDVTGVYPIVVTTTGTTKEVSIVGGGLSDTFVISGEYDNGTLTLTRNDDVDVVVTGFDTGGDNDYTTSATLSGNIITFDRTDTVGAYSVDLTTAINSAPDKFVSSGAYDEINNKIVLTLNDASTVDIDTSAIGGGDSIYTADGTLTGNRTVDLSSNTLNFENGQTYIDSGSFNPLVINRKGLGTLGNGIDFNAYNSSNAETNFARIIQVATDATAGSEDGGLWFRTMIGGALSTSVILDNREFLIDAANFTDNGFRVKDGTTDCLKVTTSKQTYIESENFNPLVINRKASGATGVGFDLNAYNSSNVEHNFARIVQVATDVTAGSEDGSLWLRVSDSGTITTKVKIETETTEFLNEGVFTKKAKVYGAGTSTGSALAIYDNDTTPNKLWDFLDNGNVNLGQATTFNFNNQPTTFDNITALDLNAKSAIAFQMRMSAGNNSISNGPRIEHYETSAYAYAKSLVFKARKTEGDIKHIAYSNSTHGFYLTSVYSAADDFRNNIPNSNRRFEIGDNLTFFQNTDLVIAPNVTTGTPALVGSEDISLQGSTLIKGAGTSTGSALAIYDNATTPNKVFEVLDDSTIKTNGNAGFTGTGNYTTFTIENGIITNAS